MKSRPSGEKRRKEMVRQERNREKAEKRKARKAEGPIPVEGDPDVVVLPSDGSEAAPGEAVATDAGVRPAVAREAAKDAEARG